MIEEELSHEISCCCLLLLLKLLLLVLLHHQAIDKADYWIFFVRLAPWIFHHS